MVGVSSAANNELFGVSTRCFNGGACKPTSNLHQIMHRGAPFPSRWSSYWERDWATIRQHLPLFSLQISHRFAPAQDNGRKKCFNGRKVFGESHQQLINPLWSGLPRAGFGLQACSRDMRSNLNICSSNLDFRYFKKFITFMLESFSLVFIFLKIRFVMYRNSFSICWKSFL